MLQYVNTGKTKKYVKYNKNNVISFSDSENSSYSSSDECQNGYFLEHNQEQIAKSIDVTNDQSFKEAIETSIIRGLPFSREKKNKFKDN